jgi:hypothetical protein
MRVQRKEWYLQLLVCASWAVPQLPSSDSSCCPTFVLLMLHWGCDGAPCDDPLLLLLVVVM